MYYIGIDWADQKYDIVILDDSGKYVQEPLVIKKSQPGFNELLKIFQKLSPQPEDFKIGIETPTDLLINFLVFWDYPLFSVHPTSMKSFRKRYRTTNARDDSYDAFVLADVARTDSVCWKKVQQDSDLTNQIRTLVFDHHRFIQRHTAAHNSFKETLKQYYPEYNQFFKDVSCPASLAFFQQFPTFNQATELTKEQLTNFFRTYKIYNNKTISRIYNILHNDHIQVNEYIVVTKIMMASGYARQLVELKKTCHEYEKLLNTALNQHPDTETFISFPGIAETTAGRLIALFGDHRELHCNAFPFQAKAGTCPVTETTGYDKNSKKGYKIVYYRVGCHKVYRDFVRNMAFASLTKADWIKAYYDKHRNMGHHHHHALRCLANLQLKILFAMWKHQKIFDENIYLAQRTRQAMKQIK